MMKTGLVKSCTITFVYTARNGDKTAQTYKPHNHADEEMTITNHRISSNNNNYYYEIIGILVIHYVPIVTFHNFDIQDYNEETTQNLQHENKLTYLTLYVLDIYKFKYLPNFTTYYLSNKCFHLLTWSFTG